MNTLVLGSKRTFQRREGHWNGRLHASPFHLSRGEDCGRRTSEHCAIQFLHLAAALGIIACAFSDGDHLIVSKSS
jgi:hypothetical protein